MANTTTQALSWSKEGYQIHSNNKIDYKLNKGAPGGRIRPIFKSCMLRGVISNSIIKNMDDRPTSIASNFS